MFRAECDATNLAAVAVTRDCVLSALSGYGKGVFARGQD
jgi:hypothetical protein